MTSNVSPEINKSTNNSLWMGVALIILGIVAIALPIFSTIFVETWVAAILTFAGIAKIVHAFQTRSGGAFAWKLVLGVLYIATAVMLLVYPLTGILTLTLFLAGFLLMEGIFEIILAFRLRGQDYWTYELINGIITVVLGAMIWFQWPIDAPWLMGTLVGVSILFSGVSRVMLSLSQSSSPEQSNQAV